MVVVVCSPWIRTYAGKRDDDRAVRDTATDHNRGCSGGGGGAAMVDAKQR